MSQATGNGPRRAVGRVLGGVSAALLFAAAIIQPEVANADDGGGSQSFLRHPSLAQAGKIGGFVQGADLRHSPPGAGKGLQVGDARKKFSAVKPPRFGEFGGGAFGFASEGIGGGRGGCDGTGR